MQREEGKFKNELKRIGTKDPVIARALAKNIVRGVGCQAHVAAHRLHGYRSADPSPWTRPRQVLARKAFMRMSMTRAQINSVSMQLQEQYCACSVAFSRAATCDARFHGARVTGATCGSHPCPEPVPGR